MAVGLDRRHVDELVAERGRHAQRELGVTKEGQAGDGLHDDPGITMNMMQTDPNSVRWEARVKAGLATINGVSIADKAKALEIGKKIVEEAAEVWMAAEHEGKDRAAEEISQLLYHLQVLMVASDITLDDVYAHL